MSGRVKRALFVLFLSSSMGAAAPEPPQISAASERALRLAPASAPAAAPPATRSLQSATVCQNIVNAKTCCQTVGCDICYGGLVWGMAESMNLTQPFFDLYGIEVSKEQREFGYFCGMSWENCHYLQNMMTFAILSKERQEGISRFGFVPPQFYTSGHCPKYVYQQLYDLRFSGEASHRAPQIVLAALLLALAVLTG